MPDFFPSRTLTIYMAKMFLVRVFAVLAILVVVLQVLDLLGESDHILAFKGNSQAEILSYIGLRIPGIIQRFLPFCVLLGTIVTLITLNQNSEVVSMKAAGLSAHQVLAPLVVASLVIAVASFAFNDRIVSRATATLNRWEGVNYGKMPSGLEAMTNVWVRDGDDLIHADVVEGRGRQTVLTAVNIYDRTGGTLSKIVTADRGTAVEGGWRLVNAVVFDVASGTKSAPSSLLALEGVRPDQFTLASVDAAGLSFARLSSAITDLKAAGRPTAALEAALWHKIAGPMSTILMPLLGAVAAFGLARSGKLFVRAVVGMFLGFMYFVADNFGLAMGNLGAYPPLLAAWGPFALFLLIGEAVLIRTEE